MKYLLLLLILVLTGCIGINEIDKIKYLQNRAEICEQVLEVFAKELNECKNI